MDIDRPTPLLGGLTPAQFMKRHWQKKPLLVRGAMPGFEALLARRELFAMAAREEIESRLVEGGSRGPWKMRQGPFGARALPPASRARWTLLLQGMDLHQAGVPALLQRFRFVPDARLDDLMISWASAGGGVGPHFDSYDVFLLQAQGRRRWRIAATIPRRSICTWRSWLAAQGEPMASTNATSRCGKMTPAACSGTHGPLSETSRDGWSTRPPKALSTRFASGFFSICRAVARISTTSEEATDGRIRGFPAPARTSTASFSPTSGRSPPPATYRPRTRRPHGARGSRISRHDPPWF